MNELLIFRYPTFDFYLLSYSFYAPNIYIHFIFSNWNSQKEMESDCLIKTKRIDAVKTVLQFVISAQCYECHDEEICLSAGKRRE